jgi:hypothetical protein
LHVAGWVLALEHAIGDRSLALKGPGESVISPPALPTQAGPSVLGPRGLRLPGGRTPHDFWQTQANGERIAPEHFETVRPDATIEITAQAWQEAARPPDAAHARAQPCSPPRALVAREDVLVEYDDRLPVGPRAAKLERYDHLVAGWATHTSRYGKRLGVPPLVLFVCRDRARARECARRADAVLIACQAYPGEYPWEWDYPGRQRILFAAERDAHEGLLSAYGVASLPPEVRASQAGGDPRTRANEPAFRPLFAAQLDVSEPGGVGR